MPPPDDLIPSLREIIKHSPDNLAIRVHLGELLLQGKEYAEAESHFRLALTQSPAHSGAKLGLVEAFYRQSKTSAALALLEGWMAQGNAPGQAYLWAARAQLEAGNAAEADKCYTRALALDPTLADPELEIRASEKTVEPEKVLATDAFSEIGLDPSRSMEKPTVTFADVGGMEKLKEEINLKIIHPMKHPEIYQAYGKKVGGGILLYGPPGCGKTYLARATAGQVKAYFMSVGIHDVLNMYLGQSESNLHDVFELARSNTPCVLFFDEVDALAANRADMRQSAGRQVINQFLSELDGIGSSNEGILILAATNAPWHLDSAFRRPGRFDRVLFVPPPDLIARGEILRIVLKDKPLMDIDYDKLAKATDGFSGADLKAVADGAVEGKLTEAIRVGKPSPLTTKDLLASAKNVKPTVKEWFSTARNYALYSNQGGIYDDILGYLKL